MASELHLQPSPAVEVTPLLLALPDSVLQLVATRLPSPDKKAARLACYALRAAVNSAVASILLTDSNLPLIAPSEPKYQQITQRCHDPQQQQQAHSRISAPLHLIFPNLTHLCLALSPSAGPDTRRADQLRRLLRHSLPALRCLRCLDLSLACRDVVLGRTTAEVYDTWAIIVEGLPVGRPVRVLLHPPTALQSRAAGMGGTSPCAAAAAAAAATNDFPLHGRNWGGLGGGGNGDCKDLYGGHGSEARTAITAGEGRYFDDRETSTVGGSSGGSGGGGAGSSCLLSDMLAWLGAHRPAAEVRLVTAPLASKRYDRPRIPSYAELLATLASTITIPGQGCRTACPAVTGLVLGPESFDPGGLASTASPGFGAARSNEAKATAASGGVSAGGGGGTALAWLPLLAAANSRGGTCLEQLTLWEAWPLPTLFGSLYGNDDGSGMPRTMVSSSCPFTGLRRLVLSDQQAVHDRDRLSADALAPLSALSCLTRLELASLTVNAAATAAAAAAAAATGRAASRSTMRRGGGRRGLPGSSGNGTASTARGLRAAAAVKALTPLPQVRHLSVYHALRVIWPPDGSDGSHGGDGGSNGGAAAAAAPLAVLFPDLRHLSCCVTHGSPGRSASERWGYLGGLGTSLRSLHLRAVAAEDLCLQGRSEVLAALTRVTSLRLSAESGKIDGIRGLARTIACLGPSLVALRLSRLNSRGTDPRVAELNLPHLTRLDFLGCGGELVAAFDGVSLSAVRLRRLEIRECETIRPADLQWAIERQVGLQQLVIQDCPGLLAITRGAAAAAAAGGGGAGGGGGGGGGPTAAATAAATALRRALRPSPRLSISISATASGEARQLRRSRRRAATPAVASAGSVVGGTAGGLGGFEMLTIGVAAVEASYNGFTTADDVDEL